MQKRGFCFRRADNQGGAGQFNTHYDWVMSQPYIFMGANAEVGRLLETFKEFSPSQRPASFSIEN